jgi:hypothetical protein
MKWLVPTIAAFALAILSLSVPVSSPIFSTQAQADRMNGKGNCSGGVCTENKRGQPAATQSTKKKKPTQ